MQNSNRPKSFWWIVISFILVPLVTSLVSTIHVISFFELSNYYFLALVLAIAFELGALSSLAGLVVMDKISKSTVWLIFFLLTIFQMMGNTYYAYDTLSTKMLQDSDLIKNFTELFGFNIYENDDVIFVKRIISILSGAILPVISLSFLHLLVNYLTKSNSSSKENKEEETKDVEVIEEEKKSPIIDTLNIGTSSVANNESINVPGAENSNTFVREDFEKVIEDKKKKLEEDKKKFTPLLDILFDNGRIKEGDVLDTYNEFIEKVDRNVYSDDDVKRFLTLCNYLDITIVSNQERTSLLSYDEAKKKLYNYLSFEN